MSHLLKATHEGIVPIGDKSLKCAILEDGTRILSVTSVFKAFDRPARGNARLIDVPVFMDAKNLQAFIGEDLRYMINPIHFIEKNGNQAYGYNALVLPLLCKMYLDARAEKPSKLKPNQLPLVRASEILLLGLANRGIIDLVDKAAGYTFLPEQVVIETILKLYVSPEILEYQKTFHLGFYREIFRLWGVPFNEQTIKRKPPFIGTITSSYVYNNLPKGSYVLAELKSKTPKTAAGNYKNRLFQSLTPLGKEELKKIINSVETLANISETKEEFKRHMEKRYGDNSQVKLLFPEYEEIKTNKLPTFNESLKGLLSVPPPQKDI